jgi:hypothetical protein
VVLTGNLGASQSRACLRSVGRRPVWFHARHTRATAGDVLSARAITYRFAFRLHLNANRSGVLGLFVEVPGHERVKLLSRFAALDVAKARDRNQVAVDKVWAFRYRRLHIYCVPATFNWIWIVNNIDKEDFINNTAKVCCFANEKSKAFASFIGIMAMILTPGLPKKLLLLHGATLLLIRCLSVC